MNITEAEYLQAYEDARGYYKDNMVKHLFLNEDMMIDGIKVGYWFIWNHMRYIGIDINLYEDLSLDKSNSYSYLKEPI